MANPWILGVDLGQTTDYTAIAILESFPKPDTSTFRMQNVFSLRHLERIQLRTAYTQIVTRIVQMLRQPILHEATLVVDQTGVGRPVVDLLRREIRSHPLIPVTITSGSSVTQQEDGSFHVPKKELVACLQSALASQRLQIAKDLPEASTLIRELLNFRVRITPSANETFGASGTHEHDDLVLATALALWGGEGMRDPLIAQKPRRRS